MARPVSAGSRRLSRWSRFARDDGGSVAIEFAFVSLPFLGLIFMILELGILFTAFMALDNAAQAAGRELRTGVFQTASKTSAAQFIAELCANMSWSTSTCASRTSVDVRTFTSFSSASAATTPYTNGAFDSTKTTFQTVPCSTITLVRVYYQLPLMLPTLDAALSSGKTGKSVLTSAIAFRSEPFPTSGVACN